MREPVDLKAGSHSNRFTCLLTTRLQFFASRYTIAQRTVTVTVTVKVKMPKDAAPETMPELGLETLFGVKGKIAVVTGAGTGIGKSELVAWRAPKLRAQRSTDQSSILFCSSPSHLSDGRRLCPKRS